MHRNVTYISQSYFILNYTSKYLKSCNFLFQIKFKIRHTHTHTRARAHAHAQTQYICYWTKRLLDLDSFLDQLTILLAIGQVYATNKFVN